MSPLEEGIGKLIGFCYTGEGYDETKASKLANIRDTLNRRRIALDIFKDSIAHELEEAKQLVDKYENDEKILPIEESHKTMYRLEILISIYLEAYLFFVVSFLDALSDVLPLFYSQAVGLDYRTKKNSIMKHVHTKNSLLSKFLAADANWEALMDYRGDIYHHPAKACRIGRRQTFDLAGKIDDRFEVLIPTKMQEKLFPSYNAVSEAMPVKIFIEQIQQTLDNSSANFLSTIYAEKAKTR